MLIRYFIHWKCQFVHSKQIDFSSWSEEKKIAQYHITPSNQLSKTAATRIKHEASVNAHLYLSKSDIYIN